MAVKTESSLIKRKSADALILPFFEGQKPAFSGKGLNSLFEAPIKAGDFKGKKEEILCHYPPKGKEKRLILLGLGKEKDLTEETLRRSYASAVRHLKNKVKSVNIQIPETDVVKDISAAVAEGVLLANYIYDANKSEKAKKVGQLIFIGGEPKSLKKAEKVCDSVCFARDLVFGNADEVTPMFLGEKAKELARAHATIKTTVFGAAQIKKHKLGLLEAVSRGTTVEPALIIVEYKGDPKSKDLTALVGKGITYDTGGLSLKPPGSMDEMRCDMSGAAAVLGTMRAVADLKLPINVVAVIGSAENSIGPNAYKPGDVYTGHAGISVEVTNTDAEGRLALADALSYVQKHYAPKRIVDVATLTGGAIIALGEEASAIMCTDDTLAAQLIAAGDATYERLCRLPLYDEYDHLLSSKSADIKNSGTRQASPIQGGVFLKKFVKNIAWAHIDIAGPAFPTKPTPYQPTQATGVCVRLFTSFLEGLCSK